MNKWKLAAAATAGLAIAGGGAALAADKLSSSDNESQAVIDDAAQRLNVTPSALSDALKQALEDRVDAAVAAGRITKAEGDELKQRIESSDVPLFLGHPGYGEHHLIGGLDVAASYLGTTEDALRSELESGKTLAQVAQEKGKSVDGLVQALYDDAKQHLDAAVTAGKLTQSQEDSILSDLKEHITDLVNGVRPPFGRFGDGLRLRHDF